MRVVEWSRLIVLTVSTVLFAFSVSLRAQQPETIPRLGFLTQTAPAGPNLDAFRQGLRDQGYIEGKTILMEYRDSDGKPDRLPTLAADLVRLNVNCIVVVGSEASLAAKNATLLSLLSWRSLQTL
jgi:hypothetical protein